MVLDRGRQNLARKDIVDTNPTRRWTKPFDQIALQTSFSLSPTSEARDELATGIVAHWGAAYPYRMLRRIVDGV